MKHKLTQEQIDKIKDKPRHYADAFDIVSLLGHIEYLDEEIKWMYKELNTHEG